MEAVNGVSEGDKGGPPPPSPLTGCYLLIVIGEPHCNEHKDIILQRVAKGVKRNIFNTRYELSDDESDSLPDPIINIHHDTRIPTQGDDIMVYNHSSTEAPKKNLPTKKSLKTTTGEKVSRGLRVLSSKDGTKKYFCIFCKNLTAKLPRHLELMHKNETEVQEISSLRKATTYRANRKVPWKTPERHMGRTIFGKFIKNKNLPSLEFCNDMAKKHFPSRTGKQLKAWVNNQLKRKAVDAAEKVKGLLSWDVNHCLVDLEKELAIITEQALEGEEARYGERLIQFASENLVTEILIHPVVSTLAQCVRNLLSSFTRHRHIIHAGYTFANNGSWTLQDGTFSSVDFSEAFQEIEVLRVIRAYENGISLDIHCAPEGDWTRLPKESFTKGCKIRVNPNDVLTAGSPSISSFISYLEPFLIPAELENILESSDVVGNIRFSRPTLYVFPGGQGDAALFGINGFNMLLDGGFSRKACFWDFVRHLDRLDAVLLTRLNNSNVNGISAVLKRKMQNAVYPQIGHFFCNIQERKAILSPDGDKDKDPLLINLLEEGQEIVSNLRHLSLTPQVCYRDSEPINLYHKVGHGTLDMYVLSPAKESKEVREFLLKWNNNDQKLFANQRSSKDFVFPLQNLVSVCALLVWQPANPEDTITRILFPGSSPQNKIFEGLDKVKNLEFIKHPVCSEKSLAPTTIMKTKQSVLDRIMQPEKKIVDNKKEKSEKTQKSPSNLTEIEMKNGEINGVQPTEKSAPVKKSDSTESEKSISKQRKIIENGEQKDKFKPKPKSEMKVKPRSESQQRKVKSNDKKPSPTTPKKQVEKTNEEQLKAKAKTSPASTPAKSAKEANNRKVVESKIKAAPKKEPLKHATVEKKETKTERKPISRRPKDISKLSGSPSKKVDGVPKLDGVSRRGKLDKEGTTDSSTVSTPSADQDSILKKDISKLTSDELQNMKAQELADLKEEQEAIKEIEAVFRKGELQEDKPSDFRKVKDLSIDDKLENDEYLIIEKTEIEQDLINEINQEEETQKIARDSEESEKQRKLSEEKEIVEKRTELQDEVQKIITSASDIIKAKEETIEASKEVSVTSPEDKIDFSTDKKDIENEVKETAQESQPDEKGSANIESGATTTAPTLPEDERMPLDEIKEDNGDQVIEEKHVKEDTKEKDVPVIQLPPKTFDNVTKLPAVVGIRLDKQSHIRDIVKTPDEVADLPVHEEAEFDHYEEYPNLTEVKSEVDELRKSETGRTGVKDKVTQEKETTDIKQRSESQEKKFASEDNKTLAKEPVEEVNLVPTEKEVLDKEKTDLDLKKEETKLPVTEDIISETKDVVVSEKKETEPVMLQDSNKKEDTKSKLPDDEKDKDEHEIDQNDSTVTKIVKEEEKNSFPVQEPPAIEKEKETTLYNGTKDLTPGHIETEEVIEKSETEVEEKQKLVQTVSESHKDKDKEVTKKPTETESETIEKDENQKLKEDVITIHTIDEKLQKLKDETSEVDHIDSKPTLEEAVHSTKEPIKVREDVAIIEKIDEKLRKLKAETEPQKIEAVEEVVTHKTAEPQHAEPVIIASESPLESPTGDEKKIDDKLAVGQKSPKEREEDVAKIVASVAEVLKSDAPLEEFEGKIPFTIPYTSYTTELRETHITTVDSPISEENKIITSVCPKTSSSYFIEEERKIAPIHEEQEIAENKISKMIKDSNELMEATSKIIQDIKQSVPKNDFESTTEDQDGESGTVHRMLVTASSEDGGEEIEICPPGTITFSKSSESSGRSSPELQSQKLSQKSSITDTVSDVTIITKSAVPSTEKVTEDLVQESQSTTDQPVRDTKKDSKSEKQFIEGTDTSVYEAKEMSELPIKTNEDEKRVDGVDDTEKNAKDNKKDLQKVQEVDSIKEMEFSHEKSTEKDEKAFTVGKSVAKEDLASEELIKEISKISNSEESQSLGTLEEKKIFEEDIEKRLKENMTSVENGEFKESTATESKHVLEAATKHLAEDVTTNGDSSKIEQVTQENIEVLLPTEESTTNAENREKPSQESLICHKKEEFKDDILTKGEVAVEFAEEDKPLEDKSVKIQDETQKSAEFTIANDKKSEDTEEFIEKGTERSIAALKTEKSEAVSVSKGKDFSDKTSEICEETKTVGDATGDNKEETYKTQISTLAEDEKASISTEKTFEESIDSPKTKKSPGEATTVDSSHETNEVIEEGKTQEDGNEQMKGLTHKALDSTLPFGKTTQNLDEVYTTSPEKKIGDECVVKTESEKSVADHTKTKLQTTEKELEQKHTHAQEITDDVSLSIAQDKPEFVESIQEIRPDISGRVESTTENIEKHQTSIEKTVTSSVEDPKDVVAKDGTIATEKRVEEKLQTGVDEQKVEITTKQEKLLESVMNLENIESETNKVELELGDEFMEAKTEKSALSLTDQRETATNIITDETCTKMEETDKQTKNAKDEEKQDLEVCGKVSEKINQLEGNKKILEDANKFGAEVSVAIEEVDNKAETVQDQQESTQNDVKQKQTEEKEKVDHYLKDKKEEVVTGVESLKEDLTKFDSDLNKTAINVISDSPNKEKIDSSHEEKTESSKTVNEFDEKSELCNGLETVEKMVVGVLTADRETTDKAEKEILSGTQKMEKEVENMQKGVEDVKELIDEIKDSVFKHDSEKENILEQAGQNIEKNFEIMKQKITSGTQKMEKEVENIQKEVEDVKELIDKTKDSVFKHDSEKEKILEQAGQDIEKNFEIMSDMTKSVVFETCGVSKDENIKEEEILEKTTRNIEKTYENVLEMAKSTSFEKCDKSADDPKKESFLEKSTHDLETTFETMSEMTKSPVFEKCVKTTDDVKEEEVLEKTMTEMPKSPVFEKCVKTTDDVKKEEVLDKTSDDIEETFEAMTKSLVLEKGDKTVDNHKKQEEFLEKTAENMEKTSETIPEMPKSMFAPSDDIKQPSSDENLENTKSSQISVDKKTDKIPDDVKDTSPETIESSPTTKMLPEDKKYSSLQESYVHQDKVSDYSNTPVSCPELASPEKQKTSEAAPDMDQHSSLSTSASGLSGKISPPATKDESLSGRTSPSLSSDKTLYKEEKQTSSKDLSPKSSRFELRESSSVVSDESKEIDQSFVRSSDKCEEEIKKKSLGEKSEEFLESDSHKFKSEKSQEKVSDKEDVEKVSENEQPNQKLDSKDQDTKESIGQFHINGTAAAHDIDVGKGDFKQKALENEHYDKTSLSTVEIQESVKPLQSEKESEKFTSDLSKSDSQKVSKQLEDKTEINVDSIDSGIETETDSKMKEAEEIKFPVAKENLKKEELLEISETKEVCIAGPSTTSQDISLSPAKHMSEELHLSGKSTPDIAEVEKIKEIEETLKHEKHIVGSSTPPTVPVSPIIKEVSSAQAEDIKTASVKSSTLTTLKDSEIRSNTPGSDDYEIGASTHSDISSGQVSRAPHLLESERIESDEDDDVPGSPMSVTSQVAHSRSSSRYDFDEERMGTKNDPMNTSFYGALPGEGDPETDFEKAMAEHRETRGENFIAVEKEVPSYLYEITKAKYSSSSLSSEQENVSGQTRLDEINKNGTDDVMTASFMSDTLPTDTKKDALDSWGKPFALPSPAPPNDNRGTPKKERKLPSNVSAKNKLNDDKKRAESPSKYKNKKINPIYVDLTYVPHHGNSYYSYVDFFKRIRARYYVFSGIEPSREVYNALLEAKQSWEDKELEVTIIPTYDTDILGYWVAENEELLTKYKIDLSPSASRCTINLQDHETSCSAYRLEF